MVIVRFELWFGIIIFLMNFLVRLIRFLNVFVDVVFSVMMVGCLVKVCSSIDFVLLLIVLIRSFCDRLMRSVFVFGLIESVGVMEVGNVKVVCFESVCDFCENFVCV